MEFVRGRPAAVPRVPSEPVRVRRPPPVPVQQPPNVLTRLLPLVMLVAAVGMVVLYLSGDRAASTRSPMYLILPVMMLVSVLATVAHGTRGRSAELDAGRREYLRYLDTVAVQSAQTAAVQHACLHRAHPDPAMLWSMAGSGRMWERRRAEPDFCRVRVGVGPVALATPLIVDDRDPVGEPDPVTEAALDDMLAACAVVPAVPVTVELRGHLGFTGAPEPARALVRAVVCQLATLHGPDDVRISARVRPGSPDWDWVKWLPHHGHGLPGARTVLILDDDGAVRPDAADVVLDLGGHGERIVAAGPDSDALSAAQAQLCARRLARWRTAAAGEGEATPWSWLLGGDAPAGARLRVPIGTGDGPDNAGAPVHLDIKEAAEGGMGPHGLCVGATGSGKSEFLRTLILGLAATHTSAELNLALIDFKGGATFLGFERLPHVAAVITNLADESHLVDRMHAALTGEMHRRQQLLRQAGLGSIGEHRRAREQGVDLAPLPVLFIVIDEFSELLSRHPDFADLFLAVGRLGRSLGMHLLLASQRLDEARLRGLDTHLSYRICLKTFSAGDSRAVLGVPDAYELPAEPGAAYLKTVDGASVRLRTTYVSGPAEQPPDRTPTVRLFTAAHTGPGSAVAAPGTRTVLDVVLDRLAGRGPKAHAVWLPPLPGPPTLTALMARYDGAHLTAPIGLADNAFAQTRELLTVDLTGSGGHVAVVGATRTGKSTLLCTLMLALAARHPPGEIAFYCLDFGGGLLAPMKRLPHTGAVAGRGDPELAGRTVAQLQALVRRRATGADRAGDGYGEAFLIVDGWAGLRNDGRGLEDAVGELAAHGLAHGVHVVITAARWADLRPALKDHLGTRIELRLGEPAESEMDRKTARQLADHPPGTALTRDGRLAALALPHLGGADVSASVTALRGRHPDGAAPPVRLLPARVDNATLPRAAVPATQVMVGIDESALNPVTVDFEETPHLIVLGDSACGKTAVLRTLCARLASDCSPEQVQRDIGDARRTLLGAVHTAHLAGYAISAAILAAHLPALVDILRARMPDADVTQRQLRDRSWWSGPEIYVVVDDHELLSGTGDPLAPLLEFLPYARDVGLHLVIARRAGGAARALFNPVLATMRELGCAALMMSTSADEGVLFGSTRPVVLPSGRATLIRRGHPDERIQTAWTEPR